MKKVRILRRRGLGNGSTLGIQEHSKHDIEIIRNDKVIPQDTDILVRWGCTSQFPAKHTLNNVKGIQSVNNKYQARLTLQKAGINIPKVYEVIDNDVNYPVIVRPHYHAQGKKFWKCNTKEELINTVSELTNMNINFYISDYIKKDREFGVFIFDNRVTGVIEKVPNLSRLKIQYPDLSDEELITIANSSNAWNVAQGTHRFENVRWGDWPMEVVKEALDSWRCFDLTFGRVDVMTKDEKPFILELNSAHSLTSEYRKQTFAKCLDWYIENGNVQNKIELDDIKSYKSIIHPALRVNQLGKNL